jgi:molybdopterin synthase sulfur carrier subunit
VIRVELPYHLRNLAGVSGELHLEVAGAVTQRSVLDALEARYPMLEGTIRDHTTKQRRAFLRFFACEEDLSHEPPDAALPEAVATGKEPFLIIGAIAGGTGRPGLGLRVDLPLVGTVEHRRRRGEKQVPRLRSG